MSKLDKLDAARYRWLRSQTVGGEEMNEPEGWDVTQWFGDGTGESFSGDELDAQIDAAMTAYTVTPAGRAFLGGVH